MAAATPTAATPTADTPTEGDLSPKLRGTIIQTERKRPQSPIVNIGDERLVPTGTVLNLYLTGEIAQGETVEGDEFFTKISQDVLVDGQVVLPRGTLVHGILSTVEEPKRAGRNGYINASFDYLTTPDGRQVLIMGNCTTRNSKGKAAAKVVGRAAGFTAIGGVIGTAVMLQVGGGFAGAAASHGSTLAAGAAIGGATGLTIAMLMKGKNVLLEPGAEMHVILSEPLKLPTMTMPDETAEDFSIPGLQVNVTGMRVSHRPSGGSGDITLTLDTSNQTENTFSTFEVGLEDELGNVFFPFPLGDADVWSSKIQPNSHHNNKITFSVDNVKSRYKLVFFRPYSRDPLAKFTLTDAMLVSHKTSKGKHVAHEAHQPN